MFSHFSFPSLAFSQIITTNSVDIVAIPRQGQFGECGAGELSFFEEPVDIEMLWTTNSNAVDDFNRAKQELAVEVSPVHLLVTRERTEAVAQLVASLPELNAIKKRSAAANLERSGLILPPRLEVLSSFLLHTLNMHIERFRVSISHRESRSTFEVNDPALTRMNKLDDMTESIRGFLSVATSFDLSFPHEEALGSAMQICIDRLTGIGLALEDSWEVANTSLLNFLDDIDALETKRSPDLQQGIKGLRFMDDDTDNGEDPFQIAFENSIDRTVATFENLLDDQNEASESESTYQVQYDFVFDVPDGIELSMVRLFYDSFKSFALPTMFLTNSAGLHLLRVNPAGSNQKTNPETPAGAMSTASDQNVRDDNSLQPLLEIGFALRSFVMDKQYSFGRGGLPLSAIGTDQIGDSNLPNRTRELFRDIDCGEIELIFSAEIFEEFADCLRDIYEPIHEMQVARGTEIDIPPPKPEKDYYALAACSSISALLLADDLSPFTRTVSTDQVFRTQRESAFSAHASSETARCLSFCAQTLTVTNLSQEGELYPTILSVDPDLFVGTPVLAQYLTTDAGSEIEMNLRGVRVVLLNQFIEESMQFFTSQDYGIGRFLKCLRQARSQASSPEVTIPNAVNPSGGLRWSIAFTESSVVMPRSTSSLDMVGWEMDSLRIGRCWEVETFRMPTETSTLSIPGLAVSHKDVPCQQQENFSISSERAEAKKCKRLFPRFWVQLRRLRLFTSLPADGVTEDPTTHASFRHFYVVDGRAEVKKPVYRRGSTHGLPEEALDPDEPKARRRWEEITVDAVSVDVVADKAPHLRILISDPIGSQSESGVKLDVQLNQFCLLLSLWFSNMQELAAKFPHSGNELEKMARSPSFGFNFPEFGTDSFKSLLRASTEFLSETGICLEHLSLRLRFDSSTFPGEASDENCGLTVEFRKAVVHVTNDSLGITRIGTGCAAASIVDESKKFDRVLTTCTSTAKHSFANLSYGLDDESQPLGHDLRTQQTFELSVFMTPTWSLYNLGIDDAGICLDDFSSVLKFLDFVSKYFNDPSCGNPSLDAADSARKLKDHLNVDNQALEITPTGLDFRLRLNKPTFTIPCDPLDDMGPGLRLGCKYLIYRYTSIDLMITHAVISDGFDLSFDDVCNPSRDSPESGRRIVEFLSFAVRIDSNYKTHHTDVSVQLPLDSSDDNAHRGRNLCVSPPVVGPAQVCIPYKQPRRFLGMAVCEVTLYIDLLPLVYSAILNLFGGSSSETASLASLYSSDDSESKSESSTEDDESNQTFSLTAAFGDVRVFSFDPVLGAHLPVAVFSIASVKVMVSQFSFSSLTTEQKESLESPPEDFQALVQAHFWADYFKLGQTRSWEPLLEAYEVFTWYERSKYRGSGLFFRSDSPFHVNISGALLVIVDEVVDSFRRMIRDTFGVNFAGEDTEKKGSTISKGYASLSDRRNVAIPDSIDSTKLVHVMPEPVRSNDRVAFSIRNMTGQELRLCRPESLEGESRAPGPAILNYVDHAQSIQLEFCPSISMVKNMSVVEVAYPGLPNSNRNVVKNAAASSHSIDLQVPGFRWLKGVEVSTFGRSFASIIPRSEELIAKAKVDWRLSNMFKLLVEVGLQNGGRQVTVRSLFSVVNKTSHTIGLLLNPDPTFEPMRSTMEVDPKAEPNTTPDTELLPGDQYQIPVLLLENALRQPGNHLGSMWLRPKLESSDHAEILEAFSGNPEEAKELSVDFSTRPVQLAKVVSESELLFEANHYNALAQNDANSGVQVSCPVMQGNFDRLSPFCYTVEVGRSPLVRASSSQGDIGAVKGNEKCHGPVAYTLSIHPTFVVVNLLPAKGRFELMHAVHRTVLWYADLEAGQQVSVHSVGLDAPLLLLLNLGFCRTPVGEGALVHHGTDSARGARAGKSESLLTG